MHRYFCVLLLILFILLNISLLRAQVVLNEILYDPNGADTQAEEWIELFNQGSDQNMGNWSLDPDNGSYYYFPNFIFPANAYVIIIIKDGGGVDDLDFSDNLGHLYINASSKLGNTSGHVDLYNSTSHNENTIVDYVEWGTGGEEHEDWAVAAGIWTENDAVPDVLEGHSIEYDGDGNSSTDWFDQSNPNPGQDNSLPVELSSFTAAFHDTYITLHWTTHSEINNQGFYILRSNEMNGEYIQVSPLIAGEGTSSERHDYLFHDRNIEREKNYWYKIKQVDYDGTVKIYGPVMVSTSKSQETGKEGALPTESRLIGNYPNPFNPGTTLTFAIGGDQPISVQLQIYDLLGRKVKDILDQIFRPGFYDIPWNGDDNYGRQVPGGIYYCRMIASTGFIQTLKLVKMN